MPGEIIAEGEVRVGINLAQFDAELRTLTGDVDRAMAELSKKKATVTVDMDIAPLESEADAIDKQLTVLDRTTVKPRADLDVSLFNTKLATANKQLDAFGARTATAHLDIDIGAASASIAAVTAEIAALRAAAEAPINLNINSSTAGAAGAGAAQGAAASAGGAGGGGAGSGLLGAALLGHAGGRGGRRMPGWAGWALGGAAGLGAGVGSVGSFAGLGAEHIILTLGGIAGSGVAAGAGAGLLGAGAAGSIAVGSGSDAAVLKSTAADAKSLGEAYSKVAEDVAVYGKSSETTEHAVAKLHYLIKQLGGARSAGVREEIKLFKEAEGVNKLWDEKTQRDRVFASHILEQGVSLGHHFVPKIAHAAEMNLPIVNQGLTPARQFLEGPEGNKIFATLEHEFKKNLPTSLHAFDEAMQFVLKTIAAASKYTGGFVETLDDLFSKWNSPQGFKSWEGEIKSLIDTFHVWAAFFKTLGRDIYDLFAQDEHTGKAIIETLTGMLVKVGEWERSTKGKHDIHNLFRVHKEEVLALLRVLPPLVTAFTGIYTTVAPPMVEAVTAVLNVVAKLMKAFEDTGPLARWALGITLILAKLRLLVPALKAVGILSAGDAVAGAAGAGGAAAGAGGMFSKVFGKLPLAADAIPGGELAGSGALGAAGGALGLTGAGVGEAAAAALPPVALAGGVALLTAALMNNGSAFSHASDRTEHYFNALKRGETTIQKARRHLHASIGEMEGAREGHFNGLSDKQATALGILPRRAQQGEEIASVQGRLQKEIHRLEMIYHNGIMTIESSWIEGLAGVKIATIESIREINKESEKGSPEWRKHTAEAMQESIKAIKDGIHNSTIAMKEGKAQIRHLLLEMLTVSGNEPSKLGQHWADLFKKKGAESVAGMIEGLSEMRPKARGEVENTITGMLSAWAKGHPKLEHQVHALNKMFEASFSKTNRHLVQGAESLQEELGKTFGSLLHNVSFDLTGIEKATQGALSNLGVNKIIVSSWESLGTRPGESNFRHSGHHATGARVNRPTFFAGEEAPQHPEWVIASNPAYKNANLGYWAEAGHALGVPGFKSGGIPYPHISGPHKLAAIGNEAITDVHSAALAYLKKLTPVGGGGIGGGFTGPWVQVMAEIAKRKHWSLSDWKELVNMESGGDPTAVNPSSGAFGLGQFLGGTLQEYRKYGAGSHNPVKQIIAMAHYIADRYHTPSQALSHEHSAGWYKGGGKVKGAATDTAVEGWAMHHVGNGDKWGYGGEWCGAFLGADMLAHGIEPPSGYPLASNWASWGEARTVADAGTVLVWPNHVGLAIGGGRMVSGNWGGGAGEVAVSNISEGPGSIIAKRRPPYSTSSGSTGTSGSSATAPTLSPAQKEARHIAHFEKHHPSGSTGTGGGTFAPGATKKEIAETNLPPLRKAPLPAWAVGLPLHQREELEGRGETTEGRRTTLTFAEALTNRAIGKAEGGLSRARSYAEKHHEFNSAAVEGARQRLKAAKEGQKAAYSAAYGFESGIIKYATKKIKEANRKLGTHLTKGDRKKWLMIKAKYEAIRATARGEKISDKEIIESDELYGEQEAIEIAEEGEAGAAYSKEAAEQAAEDASNAADAAHERATIFSEDITSLNAARYALLAGNASNILNLGTGGSLLPGHTSTATGNIFENLNAPVTSSRPGAYGPGAGGPPVGTGPAQGGDDHTRPATTVNQYLTINTPQVEPHAVASQLAWRAKVS